MFYEDREPASRIRALVSNREDNAHFTRAFLVGFMGERNEHLNGVVLHDRAPHGAPFPSTHDRAIVSAHDPGVISGCALRALAFRRLGPWSS